MSVTDMNYSLGYSKSYAGGDEKVESLIEKAGRANVFALAEKLGWLREDLPPKWVWRQLCYEVIRAAPQEPAKEA